MGSFVEYNLYQKILVTVFLLFLSMTQFLKKQVHQNDLNLYNAVTTFMYTVYNRTLPVPLQGIRC